MKPCLFAEHSPTVDETMLTTFYYQYEVGHMRSHLGHINSFLSVSILCLKKSIPTWRAA